MPIIRTKGLLPNEFLREEFLRFNRQSWRRQLGVRVFHRAVRFLLLGLDLSLGTIAISFTPCAATLLGLDLKPDILLPFCRRFGFVGNVDLGVLRQLGYRFVFSELAKSHLAFDRARNPIPFRTSAGHVRAALLSLRLKMHLIFVNRFVAEILKQFVNV